MLAACGGSTSPHADARTAARQPPAPSTEPAVATPSTARATTTSTTVPAPTTTRATTTTAPPVTTPAPTAAHLGAPATRQLVVANASAYGSSYATFTAYELRDRAWVARFGPWTARVGRNGFAPPGAKREGDGRTPSGTYGFSFFFGIDPDPGVRYEYRQVTSHGIVWDDDPASPRYNQWVDTRVGDAGARPEPMYNAPVYDYGAVIAYNTARTPGLGSAIFLHVSDGTSTAGCVALPASQLLDVLRWLDPRLGPAIRMGVGVGGPP
jgi:L,D-peptidoglycan transpeptidase YkuD (ErfK/YbiS/YcfS/YnhG family)